MTRLLLLALALCAGLVTPNLFAQPASLEADARASAERTARRYAIYAANLDRTLDAAAQAELTQLGQAQRALEEKYERDEALRPHLPRLRERTREIVGAEVAPVWNRLLIQRFPLPERVRADFPDDRRYWAALIVLGYEFSLGRSLRPPRMPEMEARDALYSRAATAAEAPYRAKGEQSREWLRFDYERLELSRSPAFKREVLARYIPLFASFVRDDPPPTSRVKLTPWQAWVRAPLWDPGIPPADVPLRGYAVLVAVPVLLLFVTPWLGAWLTGRLGRRDNASAGRTPQPSPPALPADLQTPEFPGGMRPELVVQTALVLENQVWSESSFTWQSSGGGPHHAPSVSVQTHTSQKDRLWLRLLDGREDAWTLSDGVFEARRGHVISRVTSPRRRGEEQVCLFFNHATGKWCESQWVRARHGLFLGLVFKLLLFWVVPLCAILELVQQALPDGGGRALTAAAWTAAMGGLVMALLVRAWSVRRRVRAWKLNVRPQVLAWLGASSAVLQKLLPLGLSPSQPVKDDAS